MAGLRFFVFWRLGKGLIFPYLFIRLRFVLFHIMTPVDDDLQYPFEDSQHYHFHRA